MTYRLDVIFEGALDESDTYPDEFAVQNALFHTLQGLTDDHPDGDWQVDIYDERPEPPELVERYTNTPD